MKEILKHIRIYIFRGLLAIIPLLLSFLAVALLYKLIDRKILSFLGQFIEVRHFPGLGILLLFVFLYLIGLIFSNVIGRQVLHFLEQITKQIPIIKFVYELGKQFSEGVSTASDKQAFQKVLLVKSIQQNGWVVGLLTGSVRDQVTGEDLLRILIPATHNPLLGYLILVKPEETRDPGWSVEETLKAMVSMGIIFPAEIKK